MYCFFIPEYCCGLLVILGPSSYNQGKKATNEKNATKSTKNYFNIYHISYNWSIQFSSYIVKKVEASSYMIKQGK